MGNFVLIDNIKWIDINYLIENKILCEIYK